jgi:hypothetical protein
MNNTVFFGEIKFNVINKPENAGLKLRVDIIVVGLNDTDTCEGFQDSEHPLTGFIPGTGVTQRFD